jgi:hypothetical protein
MSVPLPTAPDRYERHNEQVTRELIEARITLAERTISGGALLVLNNLSDLNNVVTARTNLGLGTMATQNANAVAITGGTLAGLTSAWIGGPQVASYIFGTHHAVNQNFAVHGPQALATGISLSSINDANSATLGMEFIGSEFRFTGTGGITGLSGLSGTFTSGVHRITMPSGSGYFDFLKNHTSSTDSTGHVFSVTAYHDGNLGVVGTQGTAINAYCIVGKNVTAMGNSHAASNVVDVRNVSNPGGAFMEVAAEFSWVGAQWLDTLGGSTPTTYTNSGIGMWGRDYSVVGSPFGQDAYISSETHYVAKYSATSTVDALHMGTNAIAVCTLPSSGPQFGSRAGQTSYPIDDGYVVTGYSGAVNSNPTDGNHAAATVGFTYGFRAGGPNGAGWTHQKTYSKLGTAFWGADYTTYGLHLYREHPAGSSGALYVQSGAGGVGIWRAPIAASDIYPLIVGKDYAGAQWIICKNLNAGATTTAALAAETDAGYALLSSASTAAGGAGLVGHSTGNMYVACGAAGNIVFRVNGTDEVQINATALFPFTSDGSALGSTTNMWSDLFLASGAVVNFNNGNLTMTHSAGALAITGVTTVCSATATPAAGSTSARLLFGTTAGFGIYYGSGAPTVSAAQGSIYLRSDGSSTSTRLYVNTDGGTTWTNVTTAA